MTKIAIAYSTRNKLATVERTLDRIMVPGFDLFWSDGSDDPSSLAFFDRKLDLATVANANVRGGPDAGIVFNLTTMLNHPNEYTHVGLVEDDVLLYDGWLDETMNLFALGEKDGLDVGAVSARCYVDRVLCQRDNYALMHNLGAGMVIFTREAARIVLDTYGTGYSLGNRRVFYQLSGIDIAPFWAFKGGEHMLGSDWQFDRHLAARGLASLALTPSKVEMLDQNPPLAQQGLAIAWKPVESRRDDKAFGIFAERSIALLQGRWQLPHILHPFDPSTGTWTIFAHQVHRLGATYDGDWRLRFCQGFGPFVWKAGGGNLAGEPLTESVTIPVSGMCELLLTGGDHGGTVRVEDPATGFQAEPVLPSEMNSGGQILSIALPVNIAYREVKLTALSTGINFFGIRVREPQPFLPGVTFDHSVLPPV